MDEKKLASALRTLAEALDPSGHASETRVIATREIEVFTTTTAAAHLACSPKTISAAAKSKRLAGFRINGRGHWRFHRDELLAWAERELKRRVA